MLKTYVLVCLLTSTVLSERNQSNVLNKLQQTDYNIKFERLELVSYEREYIKSGKVVTFKYNRTCAAVNASFVTHIDIYSDLQVELQSFKFMSNEYRPFPIRAQANLCEAFRKNTFGLAAAIKCGNFKGCPILKGAQYNICKWTIDQSQFPPLIPNGDYMLELRGLFRGIEIGIVRAYGTVSRPIPY